jgi:dipeptidyl aminopeptidase/acylaminoacyl peptidase
VRGAALAAVLALAALLPGCGADAQQASAASVRARVQAGEEVRLGGGIVVRRYGFRHGGGEVEAVLTLPVGAGPHPGIVLIPGYSRTAYDMLPVAVAMARAGFATMAVSQPGFGGSTGPADFVGPRTFAALLAATERFAAEPFVDRTRLGVYGYSRGGLAAAQLASRTDLFRAAVFGGGIYDFAAAYEEVPLGIRASMIAEAGNSDEAIRFRSPNHDMAGLDGPVLIVHGEADANAPPEQARALARRLTELGRAHELLLVPAGEHALGASQIVPPAIAFFRRHLSRTPSGTGSIRGSGSPRHPGEGRDLSENRHGPTSRAPSTNGGNLSS